jgi:hypothetical protein
MMWNPVRGKIRIAQRHFAVNSVIDGDTGYKDEVNEVKKTRYREAIPANLHPYYTCQCRKPSSLRAAWGGFLTS